MNRKNYGWALGIVLVLLIVGLAGCQTPAGRSMGQVVDDSTITAQVKASFFNDELLSGFAISVTTFEGTVTLTGAVHTADLKKRAEDLARRVNGVRAVNNLLDIKSSR